MILNELNEDILRICASKGISQAEAGRRIGLLPQSTNRLGRGRTISLSFIELMESLGYDIEIRYVKRMEK